MGGWKGDDVTRVGGLKGDDVTRVGGLLCANNFFSVSQQYQLFSSK